MLQRFAGRTGTGGDHQKENGEVIYNGSAKQATEDGLQYDHYTEEAVSTK